MNREERFITHLRRCAGGVLTATGLVSGKGPFSTPPQNRRFLNRSPKIVTGDYVHDFYCCAKFGGNPFMVKYNHFLFISHFKELTYRSDRSPDFDAWWLI